MADRILQLLGLPDNSPRQSTAYSGMFSGLPQPLANSTEPTYSSGGLSRVMDTPYRQSGGIVRPRDESAGFNPGSMDALLASQLKMGDRGAYSRGASAFLGSGYNPFTMEMGGPEGEQRAPQNQNLDALFDTAQQLGLDTSKYSRDTNVGIRGERGQNDAVQLYDDLNALTKDYVAVDHMTPDGKNMERTLYRDQGGQLVPVSEPMRRSGRQDSAFFDDSFKEMLMTIGPAVLGGFLAAPAAGAGQAASTAGAAGAAGSAGAAGATSSIPWGQIGSRALTGALQGGVTSALQGGNILQGALTGGLGGAVSGAGVPSGVLSIGKRVLGGALGMDGGSSGGGGSMSSPVAPAGASTLVGALGGSSGAAPIGEGSGSPGQLYDPNQYRLRSSLAQALLNRSGRAGDTRGDNPLTRALGEALQG